MEGRAITLLELEIFAEVSRQASLRSVARLKGLTPGHVSKILRRLEKKLSVPLFQRSPTGVCLSPDGQRLVRSADSILNLAESLYPGSAAESRRVVGIGSVSFLASHVLSRILAEGKNPGGRFRLVEVHPDDLLTGGLKGAYESALHVGPLPWTRSWESFRVGFLRWGLLARPGHPLARGPVSEADVLAYPFVVPSYWTPGGFTPGNDFCPVSWRRRKPGTEVSSAPVAAEVVGHSDQVAFLPQIVGRGRLVEVKVDEWTKPVKKPLFLSVRTDAVSQRLYRQLRDRLVSELETAGAPSAPFPS